MRAVLRVICGCLICATLAACGGSGSGGSSDRQQITNVLNGIYASMSRGDYATACGYLSQRQRTKVMAGAQRVGLTVSSCSDALSTVVKQAGITRAQLAQAFAGSGANRKVNSISIHGDQAAVTFTETANGRRYVETDALVRQDGRWRADRIIKRSQSS